MCSPAEDNAMAAAATPTAAPTAAPVDAPESAPVIAPGIAPQGIRRATDDIGPDTPVDEVMRRFPTTIRVFLDFRFMCVGCPIGCFHTVADACREHYAEVEAFLAALGTAAAEEPTEAG